MAPFFLCMLVVLGFAQVMLAANVNETIWSSIVVIRNGDSSPLISDGPTTLTPLGAQQMYAAGSSFRDRYITGNTSIQGISKSEIDNVETFTLSLLRDYVASSAQAFIQGLYPPVQNTIFSPTALLANGSSIVAPLGKFLAFLLYLTND